LGEDWRRGAQRSGAESGTKRWIELRIECFGLFEFVLQQVLFKVVPFSSRAEGVFPGVIA
jgi:hypothetical protein